MLNIYIIMSYNYKYFIIFLMILSLNCVYAGELNESSSYVELDESFIEDEYYNFDILTGNEYNNEISADNNLTTKYNASQYSSLIICDDNYAVIYGFNDNFSSNLPPAYLNNSVIPTIKNQGDYNNCWAFGSLSTLESNILNINSSMEYDFSENNMKNLMSSQSTYGIQSMQVNNGGFDSIALGYLTSWLGPVLESEDPYMSGNISTRLNSKIHIQNILINDHNLEFIKHSIYKYGAVAISYNHDANFYNNSYYSYYMNTNYTDNGHMISIVGWDDDFPKEHFNIIAPGDGAWICKNSWGENWGENGLFYISYYDYYFSERKFDVGSYTFILNDTNFYNRNYQYDVAPIKRVNINSNVVWCKNNFVSEGNDLLTSVSTYFNSPNTYYSIEIFVNNVSMCNKTGFMENMGYYTIILDNQIPLFIGDNFTVVIKLSKSENENVSFNICPDINVTSSHHPEHVSYIGNNGNNWIDLTNYLNISYRGVVCIKAFTVHNPLNTTLFLNVVNTTSRLVPTNIGAYVVDSRNNSVSKGNVTFIISDNTYIVPVVNGYANINHSFNNAGNISIYAYFDDYDYNPSNASSHISVSKDNINLTAYYSHDNTFNCTIVNVLLSSTDSINGTVSLIANNNEYWINIYDNIGFIQLPGFLEIDNSSIISYGEDENHNPASSNNFIYIENMHHDIYNSYDVNMYFKNGTRYVINLRNNGHAVIGKEVIININGINYTRITDNNGSVSIALNLNSAVYNVTAYYSDENNHLVSISNVITIQTTIISNDLIKIYRNASQFRATFLDGQGNPLANTTVSFNINGVFYNRTTNDNGTAQLNINLEPGEYIITSTNPINGEMASNSIIVLSRIVENYDLEKYYRNNSHYIVKILDDLGNPVGAGENVIFNINGVFYTRQTNETGHVQLNINLSPGNYTITTEYNGCRVSNKIKVLQTLKTHDLTKKYGTSDQFVATLLDGQGRPYANQTVSFNIHGVLYQRITNSDGQAILNINLMPGEYIITTSYYGANNANKITIITY